ncbi:winged helix-turn-helix transcriptional regulator [Paenibacillus donghaensis]|uniref:Transcriptional regulator n=1 Tax=Paenibacillus donghaensis TaxID=414771 RepID=A0A2Z2KDG8_9BACL|nr:helix-turn-helix domain-containing protein [Paenibacillus donghaensis]ASA21063.1 transcriptional regulator [Paenibacillus donghaensis]
MIRNTTFKPDISLQECSYRRLLEIISNKWTVLVIFALEDGSLRYGEVRRRIADISQKMLTQSLRQMERNGLIQREVQPSVPPVVDYQLTALGETLIPHLRQMKEWTIEYYPQVQRAREEYDTGHGVSDT